MPTLRLPKGFIPCCTPQTPPLPRTPAKTHRPTSTATFLAFQRELNTPKTMVRSMNSTGRQYPLVPGTIFHRGHDWNTIRDTMPPIYLTRTGIHSRSSIKALGDDAQVAKSGELPPKALVRVD